MKHIRKAIAISAAVAELTACSTHSEKPAPTPTSSASRTPDIGRNVWRSDLRYVGLGAKYLVAINCDTDPHGTYNASLLDQPQQVSEAFTVGATDEAVLPEKHDLTKTADFLGGITIRSLGNHSLEYARSDDAPGYAATVHGGGSTEFVPIPGKPYTLIVGVDPMSDNVSVSCEASPINPMPSTQAPNSPNIV